MTKVDKALRWLSRNPSPSAVLFVSKKSVLEEQHLNMSSDMIYTHFLKTSTDNIVRVGINTSPKAMESKAISHDTMQWNEV